jgi:hypothetical protein
MILIYLADGVESGKKEIILTPFISHPDIAG